MKRKIFIAAVTAVACAAFTAGAESTSHGHGDVDDGVIADQRAKLAAATAGVGFGPQSPRDIDSVAGTNHRAFSMAPAASQMHLCNIHFHESAEHKGGEFTTYAGNGDGHGYGTGYKYDGHLSDAELAPISMHVGETEHGDLVPGDTIEIHFVYSTALVSPGPGLGSCVSKAINNPQLRVETVVGVLVNDPNAANFNELAKVGMVGDLNQAVNLPDTLGTPVVYAGSTTGPGYNEDGSPFHVTWSVRPKVLKIDITSVGEWLHGNVFDEDHAHGSRNLVVNPALLSPIGG